MDRSMGVAVTEGRRACTAEESVEKAKAVYTAIYVVKAQIRAGGRGIAVGFTLPNHSS
ncbi:ATP-grasp domain-containing protein, partial [Staphylococcus haemolyticus]|uniref:ATP-grasp domain-containing protein n=1 Tax=Staphylococcus haemolyticus TaxID=1283 RepID=UPI0027954675